MDPLSLVSVTRDPSARTLAENRRLASNNTSPGWISPRSISDPNGTFGFARFGAVARSSGEAMGVTPSMRWRASAA